MNTRVVLFALLAVVAAAAAVLSFAALDQLGRMSGFGPLSPLLPVVVDAGAAAGSVAWLGTTGPRRRFGRGLALALLVGSVAGNALSHGLTAYGLTAPWWVVVAVSAVPPAVLGAVVHLATLTANVTPGRPMPAASFPDPGKTLAGQVDAGINLDSDEKGVATTDPPGVGTSNGRAGELIADGAGRRRLARELGMSEYEARRLLNGHRNGDKASS